MTDCIIIVLPTRQTDINKENSFRSILRTFLMDINLLINRDLINFSSWKAKLRRYSLLKLSDRLMQPAPLSSRAISRHRGMLRRLIRTYLVWGARHAWLLEGPIRRADRETASHDTTPLLFNATTAVRALRSCCPHASSSSSFTRTPSSSTPSSTSTLPGPVLAVSSALFIAFYPCLSVAFAFSRDARSIYSPKRISKDLFFFQYPSFKWIIADASVKVLLSTTHLHRALALYWAFVGGEVY